ncbi:MAG: energy-coupling factor ABC transporter permease [Gammaproteobacteria bacterium]
MDFTNPIFSPTVLWWSNLLYGLVVVLTAWTTPWRRLADNRDLNVWLGAIVAIIVLWNLRAELDDGLNLHLLGATAMALMFGWHLGLLAMGVVNAVMVLMGHIHPWNLGMNGLVYTVVPISLAYLIFLIQEAKLPRNFFVYIFVSSFFGSWLVVVATGVLSTLLLTLSDMQTHMLFQVYLPFYVPLGFSEAWLTGAHLSVFAVYKPHWVYTFRDERYLLGK